MSPSSRIRVLIVDDSASVRQALRTVLETDPRIEIMGLAPDPYVAVERIRHQIPDVILLDIEMPRMDGLTFLDKIMSQRPIPVVICSTVTVEGSEVALSALERGAIDIISKPRLGTREFFDESRVHICDAVRSAAQARLRPRRPAAPPPPKLTADAILPRPRPNTVVEATEKVVAVGASTGGTEALRVLLEGLPHEAPGMVIVQHMPEGFTTRFAERLNRSCRVAVREAADQDAVLPGRALIAPGNRHVLLKRDGTRYYVEIREGPLVSRHRPSVDVLFRSAARYAGRNAVGVLLTGMGDDGAKGMLEMKQAGSFNFAQDEASCVVFGMPAEAIALGAVDRVLPLHRIAGEVVRLCH